MKLSEIRGERALDVIAELIEPVGILAADPDVAAMFRGERKPGEANKAYTIRRLIKNVPALIRGHKRELIQIFAALDGVPVDQYVERMNLLTLPKQLLDILNDSAFTALFTSAEPTEEPSAADSALTASGE